MPAAIMPLAGGVARVYVSIRTAGFSPAREIAEALLTWWSCSGFVRARRLTGPSLLHLGTSGRVLPFGERRRVLWLSP